MVGFQTVIVLRPDQFQLKSDIYAGWHSGSANMLAVLPTGGGKSIVSSDITLDGENMGLKQVILAHRNELVGQMSLHVARRGIKHRIIGSKSAIAQITREHRNELGRSYVNPDSNCTVGSVQTVVSRKDQLKQWGAQIDLWTMDEAHHLLRDNMWGRAVELFTNARGLGVTACPQRADGMGLGRHHDGLFDHMVQGPTMRELIDAGSLSDYEIIVPATDFKIDDDAITKKGDFSQPKMREASRKSHIVGDVVTEYIRWVNSKQAICFATDVETANDIATRFIDQGIAAMSVSAKTPEAVRADFIRRFRDGRLKVLVNVDLFDEGFDVPACEVIVMARPTASLNKYLQMFGRGLRTAQGKSHGIILDMVSNWKRHGLPDKPHYWSLDRRDKRSRSEPDPEDIELKPCHACSRPYLRIYHACPYCGAEPPLPDGSGRTLEQVDGDLMLIDKSVLAEMRAAIELESPADLAQRVGKAAGSIAATAQVRHRIERIQAQQRLKAAIDQWAGCQRAIGRDDRQSYRRFYLTTGIDVLSALTQSRQDMEKMTQMIEGWYQ